MVSTNMATSWICSDTNDTIILTLEHISIVYRGEREINGRRRNIPLIECIEDGWIVASWRSRYNLFAQYLDQRCFLK